MSCYVNLVIYIGLQFRTMSCYVNLVIYIALQFRTMSCYVNLACMECSSGLDVSASEAVH